jgi:hypothetical protein
METQTMILAASHIASGIAGARASTGNLGPENYKAIADHAVQITRMIEAASQTVATSGAHSQI